LSVSAARAESSSPATSAITTSARMSTSRSIAVTRWTLVALAWSLGRRSSSAKEPFQRRVCFARGAVLRRLAFKTVRTRSDPDLQMGLTGQGSKTDLANMIRTVACRKAEGAGENDSAMPIRHSPLRQPWRSIIDAVTIVLGSSGEMRPRDIHAAVEVLLGRTVSISSVKNCLARDVDSRFERVGRGRYRVIA
jgi:hypothetical protein